MVRKGPYFERKWPLLGTLFLWDHTIIVVPEAQLWQSPDSTSSARYAAHRRPSLHVADVVVDAAVVVVVAAVAVVVVVVVVVVRTRLESLCNQHRQSVCACDYDILWALSSYTEVRAIACIRCLSVSQSVCQTRFSYFPPLDFSDFLHQASLL